MQTDSRRARSEATQKALMRAAEKLVSERGIENVSIREIVAAAGQKNESALQYHFKSLSGLLHAIRHERSAEVQARRSALLDELLAHTETPSLRDLLALMVYPAFDLARSNAGFRRYIKAFGHELMMSETSALADVTRNGGGGESGARLAALLAQALPHLDRKSYRQRMEAAVRLCSASMFHQARQRSAFRGAQAEFFYNSLLDGLEGLLTAPVSSDTRQCMGTD